MVSPTLPSISSATSATTLNDARLLLFSSSWVICVSICVSIPRPSVVDSLPQMVSLKVQKRLAAAVLGCGKRKVWLDPNEITEIHNANSRRSVRKLIQDGYVIRKPNKIHSRARVTKVSWFVGLVQVYLHRRSSLVIGTRRLAESCAQHRTAKNNARHEQLPLKPPNPDCIGEQVVSTPPSVPTRRVVASNPLRRNHPQFLIHLVAPLYPLRLPRGSGNSRLRDSFLKLRLPVSIMFGALLMGGFSISYILLSFL